MLRQDEDSAQPLRMSEASSLWDDLGLTAFFRFVLARKRSLIVIPILWLVISNLWMRSSLDIYEGQLLALPASVGSINAAGSISGGGGGLSGLLGSGGLGGLLSGTGSDPMFTIYTESWTSPWFAAEVLKNQDLTKRLFKKRWSEETKSWKQASGFLGTVVRGLFGVTHRNPAAPNTDQMLEFLKKQVKIQHDRTEVTTSVEFDDSDRSLAHDFLDFGHQVITNHIRQIQLHRARENIANILAELQKTTVSDYRLALLNELAGEEKMRMMADTNDQFAAQSLGIYVTDAPIWPQGVLIIAMSLILSVAAYSAAILWMMRREDKVPQKKSAKSQTAWSSR